MRTLLAAVGFGLLLAILTAARTRTLRGTSGALAGSVSGVAATASLAVPYLAA